MEAPSRTPEETGRLNRLQDLDLLDAAQDETDFESITDLAATLCDTRSALIALVDSERLHLLAAKGWGGLRELPRELGFSGHVVSEGQAFEIPDLGKDPRFRDNPAVVGEPYIRFFAGNPLRRRDGHVIGTLCVADPTVRRLTDGQRRGLDQLADLAIRIVESRRACQQLGESERRFHELADDAPVMIWMSGTDLWKLEFVNKRWRDFTGIQTDGPIEWAGLIHPDDLSAIGEAAVTAAIRQASHRAEFRMRNAAGDYRWVLSEANPRLDGRGNTSGHIGTCIDITDEKLARAELEATEERLRLVITATDDAPWDWDFVRNEIYYSPEWWQMLGYELDELPATPGLWLQLAHPDDVERIRQLNESVIASRYRTSRFEFRLRHKRGHYVPVESRAYIQRDEDGRVLRISGINSDLTIRKQAEEERNRAMDLLRQVSARVPGVVYQFKLRPDGTSCLPYASDAIRDIFEVEPAAVLDDAAPVFAAVHPDDLGAVSASIAESARALSPWVQEFRVRHKDGRVRWLQGNAMPQAAADGSVLWHGFITDCTARKESEKERGLLAEQLRESQKMEAVGTLAGGIAHDFNNIAAAILGNTELARQDSQSNPEALRSLEQIQLAAERARDLTRQILTFSRRQPTDRKLIALGPHVEQVVKLLRSTLLGPLVVECQIAPDAPPVLADAVQVEQVLMNLINNAAQAIAGKPGRIRVELDVQGDKVRIRVSDDGPGIDHHILPRIFEPFFTTKPVGQGTGLGLSVAYGIMQAHEGSISVDSQVGQGSVFTLLFPASARPAAGDTSAAKASATPSGSGQHILYVDDDEALRSLFQRMMERRGYKVRLAESGVEALDILSHDAADFDLLLVDYNMPGMTGIDVAREVRQRHAGLPIAIASGFITDDIRARAKELGVMDLVFKPDGVREYCAVVDRLLRHD